MNKMCRTNTQDGRSMIEMLGVLAIIGVLSVGGIAGYSKAMMKFKINKTIDQISQIVANTRTLYARQKNYGNLSGKIIYKANLAPKELFEGSGSDYKMTNTFGGEFIIRTAKKNYDNDNKAFNITLTGLPEEACIELATQDWGSGSSSGLIYVGVGYVSSDIYISENCDGYSAPDGKMACPNGKTVSTPMSVDLAVDGCSTESSKLYLTFY